MKRISLFQLFCLIALMSFAQTNSNKIPILIRCDDIGMCHSVNMAAKAVLETGIPVSMSVMTPCPWFMEGAEILKKYSNVSVGIHLTLNSEWKNYKWGPVTGKNAVPSLVDSMGYFHGSRSALFDSNPSLVEIEKELRAQIEKGLKAGLKIDYLDYHMGTAVQTPATRAIVEKLAAEYRLSISRYYEEEGVDGVYAAPIESKHDTLISKVSSLTTGPVKLLVFHIGLETPEMNAMEDLNIFGLKEMSRHRQAELNALISREFHDLLRQQQYRVVNYGMLNRERGLNAMKRPSGS